MIEFKHLKNFQILAKERNFQKAAQKLNLAQPSLSRSIQRLEHLLGAELLLRGNQSTSLTPAGELVLSHSQHILQNVENLRKELQYMQGKSSGYLSIGASPVPANTILGPILGRFFEQYPDIHIDLEVGAWQQQLEKLLRGELTLLITDVEGEIIGHESAIQSFNLPSFEAVFCTRVGHPLTYLDHLTLEDIRNYPLAIPKNLPYGVSEQFGDLFNKYRTDFSGLLHYDSFPPIKGALLHSQIVALTPQITLFDDDIKNAVRIITPVDMPKLNVFFSVVMLKKQISIPTKRLLSFLL
ncbi:LysR family transcriptional regulator [Shewanella decolorationis]|uniref:LysR family transcriptional regulator n=1 Tax=Shewanella decolorationis TaxID=256839 RepID=UPI00105714DE|nr:LysR family transcriptional regulator [Shewanella decolorationis]